ncbi:MAG TPA: metalloregulator ArsR/SmtB family transcription factor, partial [Clostridia bacterium]|nr:metalloregulator ArsR/SmtB family transcription factor [Clostridia bacterium]
LHMDNVNMIRAAMISDNEILRLAEVFKVLGDPTRIRIFYALSKCDMCVCDIAEALGMTQSAISHQLRILRDLRLVRYWKEGKTVFYSLDDEHIVQLFNQGMEHIKHSY